MSSILDSRDEKKNNKDTIVFLINQINFVIFFLQFYFVFLLHMRYISRARPFLLYIKCVCHAFVMFLCITKTYTHMY